jgi:DNA invertase Pin-like site-specific DNA recombinase
MGMNNAISYYRVSTVKQGQSGLGLEAQKMSVCLYAKSAGLNITGEFVEVETGTAKKQRVEIYKALAECKRTGATLLIAKLDRLARNVAFIATLMESGVKFVAVDNPAVTPLTLHVLAAVAEQEAKMISARTKAALGAAKARGVTLGKPENLPSNAGAISGAKRKAEAIDAYSKVMNYICIMQKQGKTYEAIAAQLNKDGYKTRNGKEFTSMTVWRMVKRVDCKKVRKAARAAWLGNK